MEQLKVKTEGVAIMLILFCGLLSGCSVPRSLGVQNGKLTDCPGSPNCVSSDTSNAAHAIPPFTLVGDPDLAWSAIRGAVAKLPRCLVVEADGAYLHAECRSSVFRFVDDLELHLRPDAGIVAVRSAARSGSYDFGVNRKRLEKLRAELVSAGIVKPLR